MLMYVFPIIFIGGIFVVFYLFKDKLMAKTIATHNAAAERWQNPEQVESDFFTDDNKFGLLRKKLGDKKIESLCTGRKPKNVVGNTLKKGAEMMLGYETFDMDAYYLAISDGELHYLHSNGEQIVDHEIFPLEDMKDVQITYDNTAMKTAKYILSDNGGSNSKTFKLSFSIEDEKYTFTCQETIDTFAKFKVEKQITYNRKMGQNPFYRVMEGTDGTDLSLLYMYSEQAIAKFKNALQPQA